MDYDVIVIGAGIVGLAVAFELSKGGMNVAVVERNRSFGMETSSRNSEVIHAGIYYPKDSLKARLCVAGNNVMYEWCKMQSVPHRQIGKYIVATNEDELGELDNIYKRGCDNGVAALEYADMSKLKKDEPNLKAVAALWSPCTGIVDTHKLMESIILRAKEQGCDFAYNHSVTGIERLSGGYSIRINTINGDDFTILCKRVVNSAGLESDKIAELAGFDVMGKNWQLHYCRGHYYRVANNKSGLVKRLIYPVPPKEKTGLGIHITLDQTGSMKLGPDAIYLNEKKQNYTVPEELRQKFFESVSKYLLGLAIEDIYPDQSGIRPKLQGPGEKVRDFVIEEGSNDGFIGFVNLIGIESPGLTSCFEIAKLVKCYFC